MRRRLHQFVLFFMFAVSLSVSARGDILLVSDNFGNQVLKYDSVTGAFLGVLISSDPGSNGGLSGPVGMRLDSNGDLLVSSQSTESILRYNALTGAFISEFASAGTGASLAGPSDFKLGPDGNWYVANFNGDSVDRLAADGTYLGAFTNGGTNVNGGAIVGTSSFAFGPDGNLYVGSFGSGNINVFDGTTGTFLNTLASNIGGASGLVFDADGDLWVAGLMDQTIREFDLAGNELTNFSTGPNTFPSFLMENPNDASEWLVALAGGGGVYRYSKTGSALGAFAVGGGMNVPGQMLIVVPEPSSLVGLSGLALLWGCVTARRRRI